MNTQFTLTKAEVQKLLSFEAHGKDIIANSVSICLPDVNNNTLTMLFLGGNDDFSARFIINISSASSDVTNTLNYFLVNVAEFAATANKVLKGADFVTVIVAGEDTTSTIIRNDVTKTEITIANHDKLTENKVKKIIQSFDDYRNCFAGNTYKIKPNAEFLDIMAIICRSMKASGYELNSAMINHNTIKYCDPQGIMEYTLKEDLSPYDKDIYIQDNLVKYMSSFIKDDVVLTLDESNQYAQIETSNGLLMITSLAENVFQYPSEEEIDIVAPSDAENITLQVNKAELVEALNTFDGVFRSELWKWNSLVLDSSEVHLNNNQIYLSHADSNASASVFVPVTVISNTEPSKSFKFLIGSAYVKDILSRMVDDNVTIIYSSGAIGTPHGTGFIIQDSVLKVICIKIIDSDA